MKYLSSIIYIYFFLIAIIIIYQIGRSIKINASKRTLDKRKRLYQQKIEQELKYLKKSAMARKAHLDDLEKNLIHIFDLVIFESVLSDLKQKNSKTVTEYCISISSAFQYLSICYRKKSSLHKAYFAHVLSLFPELIQDDDEAISYAMMHFVMDPSIYCRENAMLFFYRKSNEKLVVNSLKKMSIRKLYYSPKLLADDLMNFTGDHKELSTLLLANFEKFNANYQLGIMNYFRFSNEETKEEIYKKYTTKKHNKEVTLAMIRYFASHKYEAFLKELLKIVQDKSRAHYEYRLVAAFALSSYDKKESREALIECLSDVNFYVRKNAAISLSRMNLTKDECKKIAHIEDPYAKDMLNYIFQQEKEVTRKEGK